MRRFLFLTLFALAVATSGWLIRGAIGDEDMTDLFAPSVSVAIPEMPRDDISEVPVIVPAETNHFEAKAVESPFLPTEDHSSAFDAGDIFAQAPDKAKSTRRSELKQKIEFLERQAEEFARQGQERLAQKLRAEVQLLIAELHEHEPHELDHGHQEVPLHVEVREIDSMGQKTITATIQSLERTADELAAQGRQAEAEQYREALRGLRRVQERVQERRHEIGQLPPALAPGDVRIKFDLSPKLPEIREFERKILHLRRAAENLQEAELHDQANELRHQADKLQDDLNRLLKERNDRLRKWREEHQHEAIRGENAPFGRRHHPGNVAAALRDLRNEVRQLRNEVREMHKLLEKRHERETVEAEIEEAEAFKPTPREQPTRRDSRRRSDPAPDFDDDPIEATPSNESVPAPETELEETNTDPPAVETPAIDEDEF